MHFRTSLIIRNDAAGDRLQHPGSRGRSTRILRYFTVLHTDVDHNYGAAGEYFPARVYKTGPFFSLFRVLISENNFEISCIIVQNICNIILCNHPIGTLL